VEELTVKGRRNERSGGFTLIEVTIAMTILVVGLLALAVMQLQALRQGAGSRALTQAAVVARDQMETVQRMSWAAVAPTAGWATPGWINQAGYNPGEVPLEVEVAGVAAPRAREVYSVRWRVADIAGSADLRNVDVQVTWFEENRGNRTLALSSVRWEMQ
jgi:prepilin-type N-terminal cleavage/methylation domain-containing protein